MRTTSQEQPQTLTLTRQGQSTLLECSSCHHLIGAGAIDLDRGVATCSNCGTQVDVDAALRDDPFRRAEEVMPDGVEVLRLEKMLDIVVDWYHSAPKKFIGSIVFGSLFWNVLLIPLVLYFVFLGNILFAIFFSGHIIAGIALMSYLAAVFVNKSHIEADSEGIVIRHGPMPSPWHKSLKIPKEDIKQLFVAKHQQQFGKTKAKVPSYTLHLLTRQGKIVDLVSGMSKETQIYLEQEIETYLKIKDRPVRGEVARD